MTRCFKFLIFFFFVAVTLLGGASVCAQDGSAKCGACTTPSPPKPSPPPPPSPCPPPPAPVLSPPSPKKPPPSSYSSPPPPSGLVYITGPPGNLYPIDQSFNSAPGVTSSAGFLALLGFMLLGFLAF